MGESPSITPLRIFLSYSSEQASIAEQVCLRMRTSQHNVFFDRTNLQPGEEYDQAIIDAIRSSDLFVFLISPQSIGEGAYTRTELRFARDTWPNPAGRVLPVIAVPTDFSQIPNYLKAVTILRPDGNLPAEVSATVNDLAAGRTPQDTITGKAQLIDNIAKETEMLRRSHRVLEVDRQWDVERQKFVSGGQGNSFKLSEEMALIPLVGCIAMSIFGYVGFTARNAEFFGWSPVIWPLIIGGAGAIVAYKRASDYRSAERKYQKRRMDASSQNPQGDELPQFLSGLDHTQSPEEFLSDLTRLSTGTVVDAESEIEPRWPPPG